jgi:hypothetical protein
MRIRKTATVSSFAPGLDEVKGVCQALNTEHFSVRLPTPNGWVETAGDYKPTRDELRRLVKKWLESGPNIQKQFEADPVLAKASRVFDAFMIPTKTGLARVTYLPAPRDMTPGTPLSTALGLFLAFLLNPFNEKLAGPCKECDRYFVRNTKRQKTYCSQKCGRKHTSRESNRNKARAKKGSDIKRAQQMLHEWHKKIGKEEWKSYVHRRTGISKNRLTRAISKGELVLPDINAKETE